jgi:hypothetical protein
MGSLDITLIQMPFECSIEYAIAAGLSEKSFEVKKMPPVILTHVHTNVVKCSRPE